MPGWMTKVSAVRTTPSGAVWIGYSDEGIFGNFGWGVPGPAPIGHPGLMRFNSRLEPEWSLPQGLQPDIADVADLEAINVVGETVWACYYTDYPIARIDHDAVTIWPTDGMTVSHILVVDDRVALIGDHVVLGHLDAQHFVATASTQLELRDNARAGQLHVVEQGPVLHAITADGRWSITDLDALEATAF